MKCVILFSALFVITAGIDLSSRKDIQRRTIAEGETLRLVCNATPEHLRSYRWVYIREGTTKPRVISSGRRLAVAEPRFNLQAQKRGDHIELTLELKEIRPYETGIFMCWKQNHKPDPQVYIKVLEQGFTEAEPASVEISGPTYASYGSSVAIRCLIRPSSPGMVTWLKDGTEISLSDRAYIQTIEERNTGQMVALLKIGTARKDSNYTCKSPSQPPAEASFHLVVRVAHVDVVYADPPTNKIEYGEKLSITCVISGTDQQILWMKDGTFLQTDESYSVVNEDSSINEDGKQRSTLVVEKFSIGNNGQYTCYVPGASKDIFINIEGRSPRLLGVEGWDFVAGEVLRLSCTTQYAKNNKEIKWLFNGLPIDDSWWMEGVSREDIHNITHHDLSIPVPNSDQAGTYTCITPFGNASSTVKEIVMPYIEESPPEYINTLPGVSISLACSIAGYPAPVVYWEKFTDNQWEILEETAGLGRQLQIDLLTKILTNDRGEAIGERQELILQQIGYHHAGQYQCRGTNPKKSITVQTQIFVTEPPPVILGMTADPVKEGEDLIITCTVANPTRQVDFVYGLTAIDFSRDSKYSLLVFNEPHPSQFDPEGTYNNITTFLLTISKAELQDHGLYECHANNDVFDIINAVVLKPPPEIIEIASSPAIEEKELFISCTIVNALLDQEVIFNYNDQNLNRSNDPRYSVHMAEVSDEYEYNGHRGAKQAVFVVKIKNVRLEDSGTYFCSVQTDDFVTEASVYVLVEKKEVLVEEVEIVADVGQEILLQCLTRNWNEDVTFFHNATILLAHEDERITLQREQTGDSTFVHTLLIQNVTHSDAGRYQCFTSPFVYDDINITASELEIFEAFPLETPVKPITLMQVPMADILDIGSQLILQCETKDIAQEFEFLHNGHTFARSYVLEKIDQVEPRVSITYVEEGSKIHKRSPISLQMSLNAVHANDGGTWICRASGLEKDNILETSIDIKIYEPIAFTQTPPKENRMFQGSNVSLTCAASGTPLPRVVWYKQDQSVPFVNATGEATLTFESISKENEGAYSCAAMTERDIIVSATNITLYENDVIIKDNFESSIIVPEKSRVEIKCEAFGLDTPQVAWFREDDEFSILGIGEYYATLTITEFSEQNSGVYVCTANIPNGATVSKITELFLARKTSVLPKTSPLPTLLLGRLVDLSAPVSVEVGSNFTLLCLVSPLLNYYDVDILHDTRHLVKDEKLEVPQVDRINFMVGKGGVDERLLKITIIDAQYQDSGFYECRVNSAPRAEHSKYVNVVAEGQLPTTHRTSSTSTTADESSLTTQSSTQDSIQSIKIVEPSSENIVFEGETIEMGCTIVPNSQNGVSWSYMGPVRKAVLFTNGLRITDNSRFTLKERLDQQERMSSILRIKNVKREDIGEYICQSLNDLSVSLNRRLKVISNDYDLIPPPKISESLDEKIEVELRNIYDDHQNQTVTEPPEDQDSNQDNEISFSKQDIENTLGGDVENDEQNQLDAEEENFINPEIETDYYSYTDQEIEDPVDTLYDEEDVNLTPNETQDSSSASSYEESTEGSEQDSENVDEEIEDEYDDVEVNTEQMMKEKENESHFHIENEYTPENTEHIGIAETTEFSADETTPSPTIEFTKVATTERLPLLDDDDRDISEKPILKMQTESPSETGSLANDQHSIPPTPTTTQSSVTSIRFPTSRIPPQPVTAIEPSSVEHTTEESALTSPKETSSPTSHDNITLVTSPVTTTTTEAIELDHIVKETDWIPEESLEYGYDNIFVLTKDADDEYEIITAVPGEDVVAPEEAIVILPCPTEVVPEDITWKTDEKLLFLGSLDLAGVVGLQLSIDGNLKLLPGVPDVKNGVTYTCFVYDYNKFEDVPVTSYKVELDDKPSQAVGKDLDFPDINFDNIVVVSNTPQSAEGLVNAFNTYGIEAQKFEFQDCISSSIIEGWGKAKEFVEMSCEPMLLELDENWEVTIFYILDFIVKLPFGGAYGSSLLRVNNVSQNVSAHVYGPLVPIHSGQKPINIKCGSPIYDYSEEVSAEYCSNLASTMLIALQESYASSHKT